MNTPIHDPDEVRVLCEKSAQQAQAIANLTEKLRAAESERDQARHALQRQQAITAAIQSGRPLVGTFEYERVEVIWDHAVQRWSLVVDHDKEQRTLYRPDQLTHLAPAEAPQHARIGEGGQA